MLDSMTGSIIFTDQITGISAKADQVIEGDAVRNVPEDPLELPDDITMLDDGIKSAVIKLNRSLELASKMHGQRFVVSMRKAEESKDAATATENCIKYLFAYPIGHDHTTKMLSYLDNSISTEKDLVDLRSLLRKHSHIHRNQRNFLLN